MCIEPKEAAGEFDLPISSDASPPDILDNPPRFSASSPGALAAEQDIESPSATCGSLDEGKVDRGPQPRIIKQK